METNTQWSDQLFFNILSLIKQIAHQGMDSDMSMKIIIAVLSSLVDNEEKFNWAMQQIVNEHNAMSLSLLPADKTKH